MFIEWNDERNSIGIALIDNQHKELILILQQTNDLQHTSEERKKNLPVIIEKLIYYSQYHFSFEEEHMSKNAYPLIKEQQDLHRKFINRIIKIAGEFKSGMVDLTDEIILFLKNWIIEHILTEDKKYKEYLESIIKEQVQYE